MAKDFQVVITDPDRKREWEEVLGTDCVAVKSPIPQRANLPGKPNAKIYLLDLDLLTTDQRQRLIAHLASKFNLDRQFVADNLDAQGVPILAEHCHVAVNNPQRWF